MFLSDTLILSVELWPHPKNTFIRCTKIERKVNKEIEIYVIRLVGFFNFFSVFNRPKLCKQHVFVNLRRSNVGFIAPKLPNFIYKVRVFN